MKHISAEGIRYLLDYERDCYGRWVGSDYRHIEKMDPILKAVAEQRWKRATNAVDKALDIYLRDDPPPTQP